VTILEVINRTTPYLQKHGIESPRLTIELLLAHVLKKKRLQLYLEFEREVEPATLDVLRELVKRRVAGEPLQYVTGEAEFCGLKLAVDRRVLIPRPETELLVEVVVRRLTANGVGATSPTVVDVGTGSGCIALALAKRLPAAQIIAVDRSQEALEVAQANARTHGLEKNVRFLHGSLLLGVSGSAPVDVVVSNPPYVSRGDHAKLPREVKDFEPESALVAGADGLEVFRQLLPEARTVLSPNGFLALEFGAGQRAAVAELAGGAGYVVHEVVKDLQGHERVMVLLPRQ
jgi:release factor glutamine methyltransferase